MKDKKPQRQRFHPILSCEMRLPDLLPGCDNACMKPALSDSQVQRFPFGTLAQVAGDVSTLTASALRLCLVATLFVTVTAPVAVRAALATAFTYQVRLTESGGPANGTYDLTFALFDAANGGSQVGVTQTNLTVSATNSLISLPLNFGASAFGDGDHWLQIGGRASSPAGAAADGSGNYNVSLKSSLDLVNGPETTPATCDSGSPSFFPRTTDEDQ